MIKRLFIKFAKDNPTFYLYLFICCLSYLLQVFGSSYIYKKFFNKDISHNFDKVFKQVCMLWISLFILYIMKSKTESYLIPDIVSFVRKEVIINYLINNEANFSDKYVEKDVYKLIDFGFFFEKVFIWLLESLIPTVILIVFMNIYFLVNKPIIGIISLICNIINFVVIKSYFHKLMHVISERQMSQDKITLIIGENLNNLMDIHLNDKINDTVVNTSQILDNYKLMVKNQLNTTMNFVNTLKIVNYSFNLLNIFVLYNTSKNVQDFFEVFSIFMLFIPIFESMTQQIPIKLGNLSDLLLLANYFIKNKKINPDYIDVIDVNNTDLLRKDNKLVLDSIDSIVFDKVTFSYFSDDMNNPNDVIYNEPIIQDFMLQINKNNRVAVVSQSGSGKSTLMKLLLGFYKPQNGRILINGVDINDINLKSLRKKINYVNQKTLLLNDTIINNMRYGNNKTDKEIIDILIKYDLLKLFKNSINYEVDISGKNISFGMQKVIFLMRGILKDSEVYIFDEPLTSIDKDTRENVIRLIDDYTKGKTLIVITHDDEILSIVDRVITL